MTKSERASLLAHLQTALEIEYSTVPIYLYTYYSINRTPSTFPDSISKERQAKIQTFANKAGGLIMSVAVEEMLHMALAANLIRGLGGKPDLNLYRQKSTVYPTPLPHHSKAFNPDPTAPKGDFKVPLAPLSALQLGFFLGIEYPQKRNAKPQGSNWDTIGQFYHYIANKIEKETTDADYVDAQEQLGRDLGYYVPNNVDTIYPRHASQTGAKAAVYPDNADSGDLRRVKDRKSALHAINTICDQGEGTPGDAEFDDKSKFEDTHWYKFKTIREEIGKFSAEELSTFIHPFPSNPTIASYNPANNPQAVSAHYDYRPFAIFCNAVFTYIFQLTQLSYELSGTPQHMVFNIGMHKAMIFVLDKVIGAMRYYNLDGNGTSGSGTGPALAPTFENYHFTSLATAKDEVAALFYKTPADFQQDQTIIQRIKDMPDLVLSPEGHVRF